MISDYTDLFMIFADMRTQIRENHTINLRNLRLFLSTYQKVGIFDFKLTSMSTREEIIKVGDELIRGRGYHAFSFSDISKALDIKNASIHYHFPSKTDLGVAVVQQHIEKLDKLIASVEGKNPLVQLKAFLSVYTHTRVGNKICIVGSMAVALTTVDEVMSKEVKILVGKVIHWLTEILEEGRAQKVFRFRSTPRTRALMIAGTMLASVQLSRITGAKDFEAIKDGIVDELMM